MRNNQAHKTRPDTTGECLTKGLTSLAIICKVAVSRARAWLGRLGSEITRLVFQAATVWLLYIFSLYFLRWGWLIFENTMVGIRYATMVNPTGAAKISRVLALDFISLGLTITGLALGVSVTIGIISQLLMLRRFFYLGRPLLVKLAWTGTVGAVAAHELGYYYPINFNLAFGLCFLPTMGILGAVLTSAGKLLPELNLALFLRNLRERREIQNLKDDVAQLMGDDE